MTHADAELDFAKLYVFGAGGHGREIAWLAESAWSSAPEIEFLVDDPAFLTGAVDGRPVRLLSETELEADSRYVVAIGDPVVRRRVAGQFDARGARAATVIHPSVIRSTRVAFGDGAVVFPGCILTTGVTIGRHTHLNAACTVSHFSRVGDFSILAPGVHVTGNVTIGEGVFVGVGADIINGPPDSPLVIGDGAVVAAGACVTRSVEPGALVAGVPAVRKR